MLIRETPVKSTSTARGRVEGPGEGEAGIKSWVKRIRAQGELESRICLNFEWSCRFSPRIELIVGIANVARHGSHVFVVVVHVVVAVVVV